MFLPLARCSGCEEVARALLTSLAACGTFTAEASFKAFSHLAEVKSLILVGSPLIWPYESGVGQSTG